MKTEDILRLLQEIIEFVQERKSHDCSAYTCHYVKYSEHSFETYIWYRNLIRNLYITDREFVESFPEDIRNYFKRFESFEPNDYDNRLKMLDYLIEKYSKPFHTQK